MVQEPRTFSKQRTAPTTRVVGGQTSNRTLDRRHSAGCGAALAIVSRNTDSPMASRLCCPKRANPVLSSSEPTVRGPAS